MFVFRKAFDSLTQELLLGKLKRYGVRKICLKWFESYSKERRQCVQINDVFSNFLYLLIGVTQGSIRGPLLFLICNIHLPGACRILNSKEFADITKPIYRKKQEELFLLYNFLKKVPTCLSVNKRALKLDKTQVIAFPKNQGKEIHSSESIIERSTCVKYLGILIGKHSNFSFYIPEVVKNHQNIIQ